MLPNIHFRCGEGNMCLCGVYNGQAVSCEDISDAVARLEHSDPLIQDIELIKAVFKSLEFDANAVQPKIRSGYSYVLDDDGEGTPEGTCKVFKTLIQDFDIPV